MPYAVVDRELDLNAVVSVLESGPYAVVDRELDLNAVVEEVEAELPGSV